MGKLRLDCNTTATQDKCIIISKNEVFNTNQQVLGTLADEKLGLPCTQEREGYS